MHRINEKVNGASDSVYSAHGVVFFGYMICVDLLEELTDPRKRDLIIEAQEILKAVDDHLDPAGADFETFEEIEPLLDLLYAEIGFTKQWRYLTHQKKLQRRAARNGKRQ